MKGAPQPDAAPRFTLYGRAWCHLCEEMLQALHPIVAEFGASVDVVDIDTDPALVARYDELVPVLVWGGVELARYRLDAERLRSALAARAAKEVTRPEGSPPGTLRRRSECAV
jgi:thiol-disulfide isomerase/thioredoxin